MSGRPANLSIRISAQVANAVAGIERVQRSLQGLDERVNATTLTLGKMGAAMAGGLGLAGIATAAAGAGAALGGFAAAVKPQMAKVTQAVELYEQAQEEATTDTKKAAETMKEYQAVLKRQPAATQDTTRAMIDLRKSFQGWSDLQAPKVMPVITTALQGLKSALPALTPLVDAGTRALKPFVDSFKRAADSGAIKRVTQQLASFGGPSLGNLITSVKNLTAGFVNLFLAFGSGTAVHASTSLKDLTERFRRWSETATKSEGFQTIVDIANRMWDSILKLLPAFAQLAGALVPVAEQFSKLVQWFADIVANTPEETIRKVGLALLVLAAAVKAVQVALVLARAAQVAFNLALASNPIGLIATAITLLIVGLVGLVLWIKNSYRESERFRAIMKPAVDAVKKSWDNLTEAYRRNQDWIRPLLNYLYLFMATALRLTGSVLAKLVNSLGYVIDAFGTVARAVSIAWSALQRFGSAVLWVIGLVSRMLSLTSRIPNLSGVFSSGRSAAVAQQPAALRSATLAAPAPIVAAARSPLNVTIVIDGQQLQGRIERTVTSALNYDGARYLAGGWA